MHRSFRYLVFSEYASIPLASVDISLADILTVSPASMKIYRVLLFCTISYIQTWLEEKRPIIRRWGYAPKTLLLRFCAVSENLSLFDASYLVMAYLLYHLIPFTRRIRHNKCFTRVLVVPFCVLDVISVP